MMRRSGGDGVLLAGTSSLIAGCFGNVMTGAAGLSDLAPVKAMLRDGVPVEHILIGLKRVTDRRIDPRAAPIASWRDERFVKAVARCAFLEGLMRSLIESWSRAGMPAPAKHADASKASPPTPEPAACSNDELEQTTAVLLREIGQTPETPAEVLDFALPKIEETAPAAPPPSDDRPAVEGRDSILAAFARPREPEPPPRPSAPPPSTLKRNGL